MSKYDIHLDDVKKLHFENKTVAVIAKIIGIDGRRVSDLLKKLGLKDHNKSELKPKIVLTQEQEQLLIGGIMGDMCIFKDKLAVHYRMNLAHGMKQETYLRYKYEILKNMFCEPKIRSWIDKRTLKEYTEIRIQSNSHPFFTELYSKWYFANKKFVSDEFSKIEPLGLAIWYMDDGYKYIAKVETTRQMHHYARYHFCTNAFSVRDLKTIQDVLKTKFNLEITIGENSREIYIKSESLERFKELISPYILDDFKYKL
jgi:hypothetical protein